MAPVAFAPLLFRGFDLFVARGDKTPPDVARPTDDTDPQCMHIFVFGGSKHARFSHNALIRMREALPAESKTDAEPAE